MGRILRASLLIGLLGLVPLAVAAQEVSPTPETFLQQSTATPIAPESLPAPTEAPIIVNEALPILVSVRSDLDLLATSQLGTTRPTGWSGALDTANPQLGLLIRLDLELLAGQLLGPNTRPIGWFGAVASSPAAIARDIRHDLELLADTVIQPNVRPPGWAGDDPLMRCDRAVQALVNLLERSGFVLTVDPASPDFCPLAEVQASQYVEQTVASAPPAAQVSTANVGSTTLRPGLTGAATFLDRNARQRAGSIPRGVNFTPLARSGRQFSNMMLVQGDNFVVFIDYTFTTLTLAEFEALPDLSTTTIQIGCGAEWCGQ